MKYVVRFGASGKYLCNPFVSAIGVQAFEVEDKNQAFVFDTLRGAYEMVITINNTELYVIPLDGAS